MCCLIHVDTQNISERREKHGTSYLATWSCGRAMPTFYWGHIPQPMRCVKLSRLSFAGQGDHKGQNGQVIKVLKVAAVFMRQASLFLLQSALHKPFESFPYPVSTCFNYRRGQPR